MDLGMVGMREGMLLIVLLVVLALLLDAYRRHRRERGTPLRMKARPADAANGGSADPWPNELGETRVVERKQAPPAPGLAVAPAPLAVPDNVDIPLLVNRVALATTAAARRQRDESQAEAQAAGQASLLPPEKPAPEALSGVEELFVLKLLARNPEGFDGNAVLQILLACDLRYGTMNIFHRHEESRGRGPVQFSVANLSESGSFDLEALPSQSLRGLCFFMSLPGPSNPIKAFNYMVETAQCIVKNLDAAMLDEEHCAVTLQTLEHLRQKIRDFERRQLARA